MNLLVLDTNVLVSGMLQQLDHGLPARIMREMFDREFTPLYSVEIMDEYEAVLRRERFGFDTIFVDFIVGGIRELGILQEPLPGLSHVPQCEDPDDQKFFNLALSCDAMLITGNKRHFPENQRVLTPREYFELLQ